MLTKNLFIIVSLTLFGWKYSICQPGDLPFEQEPGNCYAKCLIKEYLYYDDYILPVYKGHQKKDNNNLYIVNREILPDTLFIRELEDTYKEIYRGGLYYEEYIVEDTTLIDEFQMDTISYKISASEKYSEWRQVLCNNEVTVQFTKDIQRELLFLGYFDYPINGEFDSTTKGALVSYQKDNSLPIGQLDYETLISLRLDHYIIK